MNIQTVASNLRNTIAGKEKMLEEYETKAIAAYGKSRYSDIEVTAIVATVEFLQINIGELKRILEDVEQCIPKSECSLDGPMIKMFRED
jgi:hypothetical protein